jgi:hypothetical protein
MSELPLRDVSAASPALGYPEAGCPPSAGEAAHAKKKGSLEELAVVGIDIGKETFHLVGFDRSGQMAIRKQIKRLALSTTFEHLPRCAVGMEAC